MLSLEYIYARLAVDAQQPPLEILCSRQPSDDAGNMRVRARIAALLDSGRGEPAASMADPFDGESLGVAVARFGLSDGHAVLVGCARRSGFPSDQDRLLLGVGANQTAIVLQRRRAERQIREQGEWLRVTLASIGDAVIATDVDGRVTFMNPVAEALTGWAMSEAQGQPLSKVFNILDEVTRDPAESPLDTVRRGGTLVARANTVLIARDGSEHPIDDSAAPIRDATGQTLGVVMVFRGSIAQRRADQHRNARLAVTQALNRAATLDEAAVGVLQALGENIAWEAGTFWMVSDDQQRLECRAQWQRPTAPLLEFAAITRRFTFATGVGLPGRVWKSGEPAWIVDSSRDEDFPRAAAATRLGLGCGFACPVTVGQRLLGVIEFFARNATPTDVELLETVADVTANFGQFIERKAAEQELQRSETQLAEFFENATIGLHWVGPDGTIVKANRAELQMLGYARDEYVGRHIADFHVDQEVICSILEKLKAGEHLVDCPARLRCKDGTIKDVLIDSSVFWNDGKFVHTRCFTRDISERTRTEAALADARSRLDAALEAGAIITWMWDIGNNLLTADRQLAQLFGLPPSAGQGTSLDDYLQAIHPDDLERIVSALDHSVKTGAPYEADYRIVQADGSIRWVVARGRAERDSQGKPVRMPGVLVDITERKRLEDELRIRLEQLADADRRREHLLASLRESEEKLRLLADTIPQLAWMAHPNGDIFWYNRRWYEYTGTTPEDVAGWGWQAVHDPDFLPQVLARWQASIAERTPFEMVFPLRGADGKFHSFLTRVHPLKDERGEILYWFGTNTDISEFMRMEAALRDADRRKDEFLATLAHELRNPLAPIRNSLEILKMGRLDAATIQQTRSVMERQVHHLVRLVDDLLDVSRVMRGKIELRRETVELAVIVARAVEMVQPLIQSQRHRLDVELPSESLLVDVDPVRLAQAVGNLLTNAAKYTDPEGHIQLRVRREGQTLVLLVKDNGIGIAADMLSQVFDLFVQVDHTSTKAQGGLGIGLTLAQNLMQMHGGSLEAHSPGLGQGSEFLLRLPLVTDARPERPAPATTTPAPSNAVFKIMVVDDNQDAATSLAALLRLRGHEVRIALDGASALATVNSYVPDLVFLDIGMPGMDGFEVARRLRQQSTLDATLLVALTGWEQQDDRRRTAEAGFDHHLVKPLDASVLETLLEALTEQHP